MGIAQVPVINGIETRPINAGVTWTLRYEWLFYLALPFLAVLARPMRFAGLVLATWVLYFFSSAGWLIREQRFLHFLCGMLAAHLVQHFHAPGRIRALPPGSAGVSPALRVLTGQNTEHLFAQSGEPGQCPDAPHAPQFVRRTWFTAIVFALLAASALGPRNLWGLAISAVTFLCFVFGNDLGRLLTIPGAKVLGTISYSIYLLHGIILHIFLRVVNHFYPIASMGSSSYWVLITVCGILIVLCSAFTYRFVEHPFIELSHTNRLKARIPDHLSVPQHS